MDTGVTGVSLACYCDHIFVGPTSTRSVLIRLDSSTVGSQAVTLSLRQLSPCFFSCFEHQRCIALRGGPCLAKKSPRGRGPSWGHRAGHAYLLRPWSSPVPAPSPLCTPRLLPGTHQSLPPKAAGGRVYPVSVPYSSTQSTSKTSVTLSLVMPSQGQLVNGAHSASTLDEATPTLTK